MALHLAPEASAAAPVDAVQAALGRAAAGLAQPAPETTAVAAADSVQQVLSGAASWRDAAPVAGRYPAEMMDVGGKGVVESQRAAAVAVAICAPLDFLHLEEKRPKRRHFSRWMKLHLRRRRFH